MGGKLENQVECQEYKIISYIYLQLLPLLESSSTGNTIVEWVLIGGESYWDIETVFGFPIEMTLLSVKDCCWTANSLTTNQTTNKVTDYLGK